MTEILIAQNRIDCENLIGKFLDDSHYDRLITQDTDAFYPGLSGVPSEENCLFKFRKGYFSQEQQDLALTHLKYVADARAGNRGIAAGTADDSSMDNKTQSENMLTGYELDMLDGIASAPDDDRFHREDSIQKVRDEYPTAESRRAFAKASSVPRWITSRTGPDNFVFENWLDQISPLSNIQRKVELEKIEPYITKSTYAAVVHSSVAGYLDRTPRLPYCRETSLSALKPDALTNALPFFQKLSDGFSELMPERYANQRAACDKIDPKFRVGDTVFTSITVNKNFRTAAHRDAGDLNTGFSNLLVVGNGKKFSGGYLILPEFRVAINIEPGDLLLINNHDCIHANTKINLEEEGAERISFVCYTREKMLECGSFEYEEARRSFVTERSRNTSHPLWRVRWNGVSAGCWASDEWYTYLEKKLGRATLEQYHPETVKAISIEDFFS